MESLEIIPFVQKCTASVSVPGSKSISNRALILATLTKASVKLQGMLVSEDVELMRKALLSLGVKIDEGTDQNELIVHGCGGIFDVKEQDIFVGNAGTVARFLTALLATQRDGVYRLDGTAAMRKRPMLELIEALENLGCQFEFLEKKGCFPFVMQTRGLKSEPWNVDATKSSQVLSALLMIAPAINKKTTIQYAGGTVSEPFVDLTLKMIQIFSTQEKCSAEKKDSEISISSEGYRAKDFTYEIEPDATAASYFLTLPIVTNGNCRVLGISKIMDQGDAAYVEVLEEIGFRMVEDNTGITSTFVGGVEKVKFDFNAISDTFLTLAAITPILPKGVKIYGIAHTRKQETDRVKAMAIELRKLGQKVIETEDSLEIYPNLESLKQKASSGISIDTYHDHRFAMSFGILGCFDLFSNGHPWLTVNNPLCCAKTFPDFFERLKMARLESHG